MPVDAVSESNREPVEVQQDDVPRVLDESFDMIQCNGEGVQLGVIVVQPVFLREVLVVADAQIEMTDSKSELGTNVFLLVNVVPDEYVLGFLSSVPLVTACVVSPWNH